MLTGSSADLVFTDAAGNRLAVNLERGSAGAKTAPARTLSSLSPDKNPRKDRVYDDFSGGMGASQRYLKNGYAYAIGADARMPRLVMPAGAVTEVTLPAGAGEINDFFSYAGHLWALASRYAVKIDGAIGNALAIAHDFGGAYSAVSAQALNGTYYVGRSGGGFTSFDGTTWTDETVFSRGFLGKSYWETQDGTADDRLIASASPTTIKYITRGLDPMVDGNWVGPVQVGDGTRAITKLVSAPRYTAIFTSGAVHGLDSRARTPALTSYLQYDDHNGGAGLHRGDMMLYGAAAGLEGVLVGSGALQQRPNPLHPGVALQIPDETPVYGRPVALAHEPGTGWVKEGLYNGTDSYLRWGRPAAEAGVQALGPWVWHGASYKFAGERISAMAYAENTANLQTYLWVATVRSSDSSIHLYYMSTPKASTPYADYLNGGLHRYQTDWSLYFSDDDFDDPGSRKIIERYTMSGEQLTDGASLAVSTAVPGVDYTLQGSLTRGTGSKFQGRTSFISTGELRSGYQFGFLIQGRSTVTRPVLLRELTARAQVSVERATQIQYRIAGGDGVVLNNKTIGRGDPDIVLARLQGLTRQGPVTLRNHRRKTMSVTVERDVGWEDRDAHTGEHAGLDRTITLTVTVLSQTIRYNTGDIYNTGSSYG
jgi:hypothetical protein